MGLCAFLFRENWHQLSFATPGRAANNAFPSAQQLLNCDCRLASLEESAAHRVVHRINVIGDVVVEPEFRTKTTFNKIAHWIVCIGYTTIEFANLRLSQTEVVVCVRILACDAPAQKSLALVPELQESRVEFPLRSPGWLTKLGFKSKRIFGCVQSQLSRTHQRPLEATSLTIPCAYPVITSLPC